MNNIFYYDILLGKLWYSSREKKLQYMAEPRGGPWIVLKKCFRRQKVQGVFLKSAKQYVKDENFSIHMRRRL